ncbi:outer membrane receptor protein involved in Fe transport [Povalibacter uvarum]|uniref:Outer membrane receptor protein involved in Fe transport n=1 Tax=Povalibacter uvarum TaxID=732238 RepID=A0A841HMR2_9GAMM|nr:TonB-dependent receptor [Povalibacter uvarum]MBB6093468.1 outer membrane receptor protein involved in Fe transport [Povalibacter uvarum]
MNRYTKARSRRYSGYPAFLLMPCLATTALAQTAATGLEEVVVTGSHIRRDNFDLTSPLDVVSNVDIAQTGAAKIGETLYNQTFNFGVSRVQNFLGGTQLTDGTATNSNLRGLGVGATLNLMNGKRTLTNANFGYPQMAIERIETLLDGASALYGSNAIGGVQNFVPYTRYNGLEVMADYRQREDGGGAETLFGVMGGFSSETDNFVFAFELQDRDAILTYDIPYFTNVAASASGAGHPGTYFVPTRDANGVLNRNPTTGAVVTPATPDPTCGNQTNNPGNVNSIPGNRRFGVVNGTTCSFYFGEFWDYIPDLEAMKFYAHYDHEFNDRLRMNFEAIFDQATDTRRGSPVDFGANANIVHNILSNGVIPGEHPGNPFRAMNSAGQPLFAQDANGDGVPDRNPATNEVILSGAPTDPSSGVAFNEDVRISGWRPLGKDFQGLPGVSNDDNSSPLINKPTFSRYNGGLEVKVTDNWFLDADYTYNQYKDLQTRADASPNAIALGLEGRLGPNQNMWFNPFGTSQIECQNRVCGSTITSSTSAAYNSQFVMDQVAYRSTWNSDTTMQIFDLVMSSGKLFSLPGGEAGLAVGYQWLDYEEDYYADSHRAGCDSWSLGCDSDFNEGRVTNSYFAEIDLPLMDNKAGNLSVNLAGRYTEVEELESFDPKVGIVYSPLDMLSLRASWGTSFQAPSLREQKSIVNVTRETADPTCANSGGNCSPATRNFVVNSVAGDPLLEPETAESFNVGFTVRLLDGDLILQADWVNIDFTDRITQFPGDAILNADAANYRTYFTAQCGATPTQACLSTAHAAWVGGLNSPLIEHAGFDLSRIITSYINAASVETTQIDMSVDYALDLGGAGQLRLGASATNIQQFEYQSVQNGPITDAKGKVNEGTAYPALPEWRVAPQVSWTLGAHNVTLLGEYHTSVFVRMVGPNELTLPAYSRFNLAYSFRFNDFLSDNSEGSITVGAFNAFDQLATPYNTAGGYNSQLEDPIGRTWYARFTQSF